MHIYRHLYKVYSSCGFQQGDNIGITSLTCRHFTLSNSIMCSDSYPIPILPPFFLYHTYIPYFLIQRFVYFLVSFLFLLHACVHTRCSHQVYNSNGPHNKGPQYKKPLHVTNQGPSGYIADWTPACVTAIYVVVACCWCVLIRVLEKHECSLIG